MIETSKVSKTYMSSDCIYTYENYYTKETIEYFETIVKFVKKIKSESNGIIIPEYRVYGDGVILTYDIDLEDSRLLINNINIGITERKRIVKELSEIFILIKEYSEEYDIEIKSFTDDFILYDTKNNKFYFDLIRIFLECQDMDKVVNENPEFYLPLALSDGPKTIGMMDAENNKDKIESKSLNIRNTNIFLSLLSYRILTGGTILKFYPLSRLYSHLAEGNLETNEARMSDAAKKELLPENFFMDYLKLCYANAGNSSLYSESEDDNTLLHFTTRMWIKKMGSDDCSCGRGTLIKVDGLLECNYCHKKEIGYAGSKKLFIYPVDAPNDFRNSNIYKLKDLNSDISGDDSILLKYSRDKNGKPHMLLYFSVTKKIMVELFGNYFIPSNKSHGMRYMDITELLDVDALREDGKLKIKLIYDERVEVELWLI